MPNKQKILSYNIVMKFIKPVYAHCDGPCGHYETDTLMNSALTCQKVIAKVLALEESGSDNIQDKQQYVRYTMIKEEHAQICKQQIYILWSDYFKAIHYEKYPDLTQRLYKMAQICSQIKQTLDLELVIELIRQIASLNEIFRETQKA